MTAGHAEPKLPLRKARIIGSPHHPALLRQIVSATRQTITLRTAVRCTFPWPARIHPDDVRQIGEDVRSGKARA